MRTRTTAVLMLGLASILAGCKAASGGQDMSYIFEIPAEPVDVAVTLDTAGTVEALIPVEGGTISATGADGTVYTLEIPSDALVNETTVSLTPVSDISGMPFGGEQTYAVQLGPEGLFLYNHAILTITPAEEFPLGEQIFFGYLEDGKDLILASPVVDSSEIQIQVQHFSGTGVTKGLLADIEPVRERLGGSAERRLDSAVAAETTRAWSAGASGETFIGALRALEEAFRQYEEQVVKPRVEAAGDSCAAGRLAIQTVVKVYLLRFEAGFSSVPPFEKYPDLWDKFVRVCVQEEYELCVDQHIIHRMRSVWAEFKSLASEYPISAAALQEARDLTVKCLTFRLEFESTGTLDAGGGGFTSSVTSEITLRFNPDDFTISGEAPQVVEAYEFHLPSCTVSNYVTEGGTFKVFRLTIVEAPYDRLDPLGKVHDFKLSYLPGITSASYDITCPPGGTIHQPPGGAAWMTAFLATHIDEMATGVSDPAIGSDAGVITMDWEIFGDEYFAKKEWMKEAPNIVEAGTFMLYHTPGG